MIGKKKIIIISVVVIAVLLTSVILTAMLLKSGSGTSLPDDEHFRTPDYLLDITTVDGYMQKDRFLTYKYGAESIGLNDSNKDSFGDEVSFFITYFDRLVSGDTDGYNALFSDEYYKTNSPAERFTKQMIYEPVAEKLSETSSDGAAEYVFAVTYRIYDNDGTFRPEIGSDGSKVQFFYLSDKSGSVLIDKISDKYE